MTAFVIFIHVIACLFLCTIILMQSGRGGGLTENFAAAGDMFGTQTSEFLIKGTTILAVVFLSTSLSLAFLSSRKDDSLMAGKVAAQPAAANEAGDLLQDLAVNAATTAEDAVEEVPQALDLGAVQGVLDSAAEDAAPATAQP